MQAASMTMASSAISRKPAALPDARAYMSIVDCPAFLQAVADGNENAVEEFHNDGVGRLNKVLFDSSRDCVDMLGVIICHALHLQAIDLPHFVDNAV